jgi:uncharacterized protein (TIGR03000 family)
VAKIQAYRLQDLVAREVSEAYAQMQSARDRIVMAEDGLRKAEQSASDNFKALGEVKRVGANVAILVIRPQEAIAAEQALMQAYYDYYGSVADYNRTQFLLYRSLGNPAQALPMLDDLLDRMKAPVETNAPHPPAPCSPPVGAESNRNAVMNAGGNTAAVETASVDRISAYLHVRLPANAELYCDNIKLSLTGNERNFTSPPLPFGRMFPYEIRIRWIGPEGKIVEQVRSVQVEAGRHTQLDFFDGKPN